MLTYDQLDVIADSYIPALVIISIVVLATAVFKCGIKCKLLEMTALSTAIFIVYSLMFLDNAFKIWPGFGLDYSTHTALSLVFVVYLSAKNKTLLLGSVFSFVLYVLLMLYQGYHTVADIFSTSVVLLPILWILFHREILVKAANKALKPAP